MPLLIGADPEFFVKKNGEFISGHTFECGTKSLPMKTEHGHVQVDGVALEVNVPPAETRDGFVANVLAVISDLHEIVGPAGCEVIAQPTALFDQKYFKSLPRAVRQLGCNPDYNAYTMGLNDTPNGRVPFRTGAGHIHLGWTKDQDTQDWSFFVACCDLARQLDYFVGLRTLKFDKDNTRRSLYGNAGAFRPKPYGMEYRVPSSAWLTDRTLMEEVYDASVAGFEYTNSGGDMDLEFDQFARTCIDKNVTNWETLCPAVAKEIGYAD